MTQNQVVRWLKDGGELFAAQTLAECTWDLVYVDTLFPISGDGPTTELCELMIYAPRHILDELSGKLKAASDAIETAITRCAEGERLHIQEIRWVPSLAPASAHPAPEVIGSVLERLNGSFVRETWQKALDRRSTDPDGAITAARALLESVCKHILDEAGKTYPAGAKLNQLYSETASALGLDPARQNDSLVKRICGACVTIVDGVGSLRNALGDAHGRGSRSAQPSGHVADLAINTAGALASYVTSVRESKRSGTK